MTEGYYEEPMKWTLRSNNSVYENERREGIDYVERASVRNKKLEKICRYYDSAKVTNLTVLLAVIGSAVISLICLFVLVQASNSSDKDFSKIQIMLAEIRKNITSQRALSTPQKENEEAPDKEKDSCDYSYGNKCFRLVRWTSNLTLAEAREECSKLQGRLANIYNEKDFQQITTILKDSLLPNEQEMRAWTGMTVNLKTRRMTFSDLTLPEKELPWYPGRWFAPKLPYLAVKIRSIPNVYARGMYDTRSTERIETALCEI